MFCTECGKDNQDTNKFCYNCGSKLISKQTQPAIPKGDLSNTNPDKIPKPIKLSTEIISKKMPTKHKVFIGLFVMVILVIGYFDGKSKSSNENKASNVSKPNINRLTQTSMESVCKSYIGQHFSKPENIITAKFIKKDAGVNFISASYVRNSDNSKWEYVCSITGNNIIWASIREDGSLGRWRYEDSREIINGKVKI